ncbi:hypothetical protein [Rickettsia helvetica]|uniref:Archease domain-containing protein n=1 Tax=Rickettsia helvetica TaxID=35789 RepID=A0ABM9NBM5_RICHE|nr:hypothetical protein [Rickettsia helvetica]MCZ6884096.1 hypothetical protein [Rickettsia endosymbiont of Ixodes ricinus]MCZ6896596.1 hypothetical protein [Rickettsia endosymbiont of Ixodes ricinus]
MLEYVVFGIARLAHSGANTISDIVEACNNAIDTISNTTPEGIEEPTLESKDIEDDWVEVSLIGK